MLVLSQRAIWKVRCVCVFVMRKVELEGEYKAEEPMKESVRDKELSLNRSQ